MIDHPIAPEVLGELLTYDPVTGSLFWKVRPISMFCDGKQSAAHNCEAWNSKNAGQKALAHIEKSGHLRGAIFGRNYLAHRVVWALNKGAWPTEMLDHVNGDPSDNRMENLREVDRATNGRNARRSKKNSSGITGVSWYRLRGVWMAYINIDGRRKTIGYFPRKRDAIRARKAAERANGYHANHGRVTDASQKGA